MKMKRWQFDLWIIICTLTFFSFLPFMFLSTCLNSFHWHSWSRGMKKSQQFIQWKCTTCQQCYRSFYMYNPYIHFCVFLLSFGGFVCNWMSLLFIQGGSVWDMEQQVLQMWLWRRRIPQWVSLHQDRFFDGARRGLHARYRSAESTAFVKSVSCWNWISSELTLESFLAQTFNLETILQKRQWVFSLISNSNDNNRL